MAMPDFTALSRTSRCTVGVRSTISLRRLVRTRSLGSGRFFIGWLLLGQQFTNGGADVPAEVHVVCRDEIQLVTEFAAVELPVADEEPAEDDPQVRKSPRQEHGQGLGLIERTS